MVDPGALHSMLIEMHGGMLTLAALCTLATVIATLQQKYHIIRSLDTFMKKLLRYTEPTAYLAAIGGVVGLVVSAIVGFYAWPVEALMTSHLGLTKIMFTIFATELWILFVAIRSKYGEELWKNRGLATVYVCIGFAGFFFMVLTGSFGGHMAGKGSVLDPIYEVLGVNPETYWIIKFEMLPILLSAAFIELAALLAIFLHVRGKAKT